MTGATGAATVTAVGASSVSADTEPDGSFVLTGLAPGHYTVSAAQPGSTFMPVSQDIALVDRDLTAISFDRQAPGEGLSSDDLARIDAMPDDWLPENQVVLPNGHTLAEYADSRGITADDIGPMPDAPRTADGGAAATLPPAVGPQQKKNDLVSRMVRVAERYACGRAPMNRCTTWDFPADPADPVNLPMQTGLTYVYGGKDPTKRTKPVDGCPQSTRGMDCSGLVYLLATSAGIDLPQGTAATQSDPDAWVLPADWQLKMKVVADGTIQAGDIVSWGDHIGIAETSGSTSTARVISATGQPGECLKNISPPRGPRSLPVSALRTTPPTAILRLVTTLSGDFDMHIRCTAETTDAAIVSFMIDNDNGGAFHAKGTGTDYNGTPLCFNLDGNYDQLNNIVTATLAFCDGTRSDSFAEKLLEDDTGYFTLTKVIDNTGCVGEGRLVRKGAGAPPATGNAPPAERSDATLSGPR